jgi:hypothetical protein
LNNFGQYLKRFFGVVSEVQKRGRKGVFMKKLMLFTTVLMMVATSAVFGQGLETFDNLGITGSSYQDGTFLGQDGSTWTFWQCRGDLQITGKAITLGRNRTPQAEVYSGTIGGGIGDLNFNYMQAFGTNVNLNVEVNGTVVGNVTTSGQQGVVLNSGTIVVNVSGDFVIRFINVNSGDGQVVIDDVEWTGHGAPPEPTATPTPVPFVPIYDIQFTTDPGGFSPYEGQVVTTSGIVTAQQDDNRNVFIQDGTGAWSGLLLDMPGGMSNTYNPGDELEVTGDVQEYFGMTRLANITEVNVMTVGNTLPAFEILNTADVGVEQWESVLVRVENVTVTDEDLGYGEWEVDDGSGPVRINNTYHDHFPVLNDLYDFVQGPLNFTFSNFKIEPRDANDIDAAPPEPTPTPTPLPTQPCEEQLLLNGDFEQWSNAPDGPPDNWIPDPDISTSQSTDPVYEGTYSAHVVKTTGSRGDLDQLVIYQINPGALYTLSCWVFDENVDSGDRVRAWINWYEFPDGTGYIGQDQTDYSIAQSEWQNLSVTGTAPIDASSAIVRVAFYGATDTEFYVDDTIFFEVCSGTPTPTPEPTATPEPAPIPATGPVGISLLLLAVSALIAMSGLKRR